MSKWVHFFYTAGDGYGAIDVEQKVYGPISREFIDQVVEVIRSGLKLSQKTKIVIVCWQRFEE